MATKYDFSGRSVWVTGAAQGIGYAIAQAFKKSGAQVTGFDLTIPQDQDKYGFTILKMDVSKPLEVKEVVSRLLDEGNKLDVLVSAAGILRLGQTDELTYEDFQSSFNVNVGGTFNLLKNTMPLFRQQRHGAIIAVCSNSAHAPRLGMSAYGASKAALRSLCQTAALELAPYNVRCNMVSPGSTDTEMLRGMFKGSPEDGLRKLISGFPEQFKLGIPLQKVGSPDEIASIVLFLASDGASHVVMQDIVADGGATLGA